MPIDMSRLRGWVPNPEGVEQVMGELPRPVFADAAQGLLDEPLRDTYLWEYLIECFPHYRRGAQGIGSCVAWGGELAETILLAKHWAKHGQTPLAEVATESNYGGCRVEALGKKTAGYSDGAFGGAMAKFAKNFGVVLRQDYSEITGNPEHDLRVYDVQKEKRWGNFGCGGQNDKGKLDDIARLHPVQEISQMRSFDDVAKAVAVTRCPVTIASMYGCSMRRNKYGESPRSGSWAHQMMIAAVRFGRRPGAWICQSWGPNSASGPSGDDYCDDLPDGGTPENILGFGWWAPAEDVDWICRSGDCWYYGDVEGMKIDRTPMPHEWENRNQTWV